MKKLWEELSTLQLKMRCSCNCVCGAQENLYMAKQERRLMQILMELNRVYIVISGNILMMEPMPSFAQDFSLLIQEEK